MTSGLPRQLTEFPDVTALDYRQFNEAIQTGRCGFDCRSTLNESRTFYRMYELQRRIRQDADRRFEAFRKKMLEAIDYMNETGTWPDDDTKQ